MANKPKRRYATSTLIDAKTCVPWLAATGSLAYTPENPPATDYFFQYTWILPEIFNPETNIRRHHYFGEPVRGRAEPLFEFWRQARRGKLQRVFFSLGSRADGKLCAPIAVYRARLRRYSDAEEWLLIQQGSYQWLSVSDQPYVEDGYILLYRGIGKAPLFSHPRLDQEPQTAAERETWQTYLALQWQMMSDSVLSFNTIHDRTKRCETGCLNDGTWLADQLALAAGLEIKSSGLVGQLWTAATAAYSLQRWVAEAKFGPNFVVGKAPISNIRLTTFFAGEAEARLVDPSQFHFVEAVGCKLVESLLTK